MLALLLRRISLRHARLAPGQTALLVLILALGVGVFTAVRLANRAALSSFTHFTNTLTGNSDFLIQAPGGPLLESVLPELGDALADLAVQIHPVVESTGAEPIPPDAPEARRFGRRTFTLLGVDLVSVANLPAQQAAAATFFGENSTAARPLEFFDLFGAETLAWVSPALANSPPETLDLIINDRTIRLKVAGTVPQPPEAPAAPATLVVLDLPRLQTLLGREGRIDRVEFILEPGGNLAARRAELEARLTRLGTAESPGLPPRWVVGTPGTRRESAETMTAAFRLNLTVLSLIALLVGLYLVFQALDGAVVRRRAEIAVLRSLGVSAATIRRAWLLEAGALGLAGSALGLLIGWAGAQLAVRAVGQTVNALYFSTSVNAARLDGTEALASLLAGVLASLIAGWTPARAASETPAAQVLVRSAPGAIGGRWLRSWPLALTAIAVGVLLSRLPPLNLEGGARFPLAGHLAAFCWILGGGVLASLALPALGRALRPIGDLSADARVATRHLARPTGRHRLSVAALVCATAMAAGMAVLVSSFERSVRGWIESALQADLYISSSGAQAAGSDNKLSPETWRALAAHPTVAHSAVFTAQPILLNGIPTTLGGGDLADQAKRGGFVWAGPPPPPEALDATRNAGLALASESFAERFRIRSGDTVMVPTPSGPRPLRVAALYADYGNERGALLVDRSHLVEWFGDDRATSLALDLRPDARPETVRAGLLADYPGISIFTNSALRAEVLRVFRQTFSITYALELIGLVVAMAGLGLGLASVLLDRRDELTTLRALGFRRLELARAAAIEGGTLALCGVATGITLALALGWLLIQVINKQSFGWTLAYELPLLQLASLAVLVTAAGAGTGYIVGRRFADLPAEREE